MSSTPLVFSFGLIYEVCAVVTCLAGSNLSLMLATASLRLRMPTLMVLTALQFCIQSIFSLHFISMAGMKLAGVTWGFDVGLTCISFLTVAIFGTSAVAMSLFMRRDLEPQIAAASPDLGRDRTFRAYGRLLRFVLWRVPFLKLLGAVVLMVAGAAGCHHLGMWSMQGDGGAHVASQLNYWSFITTGVIGGSVCVVAVLAFIVVPEGLPALVTAALLAAGIAAFHYSSATIGMEYFEGIDGINTHSVIGEELVIAFIIAMCVVGQVITAIFSQIVVQDRDIMEKQVRVAQTLADFITDMDLQSAKAMQFEAHCPSKLEETLFRIVSNLELYRPYLPDTLFQNALDPDPEAKPTDDDQNHSVVVSSDVESNGESISPASAHCRSATNLPTSLSGPRRISHPTSHSKANRNLALGLRPSRVVVLRVRLPYASGHDPSTEEEVEGYLQSFMAVTTAAVRRHSGTTVSCSSGLLVAMWTSIRPEVAVECAMDIKAHYPAPLVQVVQSGHFLVGNLAAEHLRSFNLVGPLDWEGLLMLRMGVGENGHVFITSNEWDSVRYKFTCLPYERILLSGAACTVYTVLASRHSNSMQNHEWMYECSEFQGQSLQPVDRCWFNFIRGSYAEAKVMASDLAGGPPWYSPHLHRLIQDATNVGLREPLKRLDALAWARDSPHDHG